MSVERLSGTRWPNTEKIRLTIIWRCFESHEQLDRQEIEERLLHDREGGWATKRRQHDWMRNFARAQSETAYTVHGQTGPRDAADTSVVGKSASPVALPEEPQCRRNRCQYRGVAPAEAIFVGPPIRNDSSVRLRRVHCRIETCRLACVQISPEYNLTQTERTKPGFREG